jgi:hypothetical protein
MVWHYGHAVYFADAAMIRLQKFNSAAMLPVMTTLTQSVRLSPP